MRATTGRKLLAYLEKLLNIPFGAADEINERAFCKGSY
jgi:hypothetical protein